MAANNKRGTKAGSDSAPGRSASAENELKLLFIVSYFLLWLSGLVVYLVYGRTSKRIRFHAVQAVLYGIVFTVLEVIFAVVGPFVGLLSALFALVLLVLWLYGLYVGYRAMEGEDIKITTIGDLAERYS